LNPTDGTTEPPGGGAAKLVEVGRVTKPHGLRGQVVVDLITDRDERVGPGARLHSDAGTLVVASARRQPKRAGHTPRQQWVVAFEGYDGREAVEALRGMVLRAEPIDDPDEMWVDDLVGAEVVLGATGETVGTCVAVVANPASDLLELDGGALVPVVFVTEHRPGRVVIDPPEGLFDL
jgi:16S rRNA processing protein RimM